MITSVKAFASLSPANLVFNNNNNKKKNFAQLGNNVVDPIRLLCAQAGSSLSLILFLILVKTVMFNLLNGAPVIIAASNEPQQQHRKTQLKEALEVLEQSEECAKLLRCINFSGSVSIEENKASCKRNYVSCKGQGHIHHLNMLLRAVDEVA